MGRIVVSEFVSIDGVAEAPGGEPGYRHTNWVGERFDEAWFGYKVEEALAHEALLIGRVTYESFAEAWPDRDGPIADKFNAMAKHVASTTLTAPAWRNTVVLQGDPLDAAAALKRETDGDLLVHGSLTLVDGLRARRLVDEHRLMISPWCWGAGGCSATRPTPWRSRWPTAAAFRTACCWRPTGRPEGQRKKPPPGRGLSMHGT